MKVSKYENTFDKMTKTPIPSLILTLSVPTIISMLITNVYNLVDTAFVGRLGTSASGAVGIVFGFMSIIQAYGFLFGQGAGSLLSRALGSRKNEEANKYATIGFFSSFLCGCILLVIGFLWLDKMIVILGSTPTIAPYAKTYITYILLAAPFMGTCFTLNNMLRYEGKANLGMIGLLVGAFLNMAGDPILMFGLNMGIAGAGLSTALSQFISWCVLISMYILGKTEIKITFRTRIKDPKALLDIVTTGFPSLLRQGLTSIGTVILNNLCRGYGDAAVAAMSIVSRIFFFAFSITLGIGQGFQPVSGFNYGAKKWSRLRSGYFFTVGISEAIIIVECILMVIYADPLIQIFRDDPEVIAIGARSLRLHAIAQLAMPPCMATEMLFQSIGYKLDATILSSLRNGVLFIPALLILSATRGLAGIQEAQPLAIVLCLPIVIPFAIRFFRKLPKENGEEMAT